MDIHKTNELVKNFFLLLEQIMGLNPPFGHKAALANKCVDKAVEFKPKLVILIVPPETERHGFFFIVYRLYTSLLTLP